jgi:hypothetical protein
MVLELDAACSGVSIDSPDPAVEPQELTDVEISTFLESFSTSPTWVNHP